MIAKQIQQAGNTPAPTSTGGFSNRFTRRLWPLRTSLTSFRSWGLSSLFLLTVLMVQAQKTQTPGKAGMAQTEETYVVNTDRTTLTWKARKVTGSHEGTVRLKKGSLTVDRRVLTSGQFVIDMTSITVSDIKDPKTNAKLVGHLKSEDFFNVEEHPTAVFEITRSKPILQEEEGDPNYEITGNMTIKGITREISFEALVIFSKRGVRAIGSMKLDRTEWDIKYGSGKFFEDLGDRMIYDEFEISLLLMADPK